MQERLPLSIFKVYECQTKRVGEESQRIQLILQLNLLVDGEILVNQVLNRAWMRKSVKVVQRLVKGARSGPGAVGPTINVFLWNHWWIDLGEHLQMMGKLRIKSVGGFRKDSKTFFQTSIT